MTYPILRVSVNGGPPQVGAGAGVAASAGDTLELSPDSTTGVTDWRWEIYGYPPDFTVPAGWSTDASSGAYYYLGAAPPSFVADEWGKYMLSVATSADGVALGTDTDTAVSILSDEDVEDLGERESTQFGRSWAASVRRTLRTLSDGIAGGGGSLTAPSNPADDGKVAIASGGDLTYALLANANVSASAAIAGTKISPNFGSQNVATTGTLASGNATITGTGTFSSKLGIGTAVLTMLAGVTLPTGSAILSGSTSGGHGLVGEIYGAHASSALVVFSKARGSKGSESAISTSDQIFAIGGYAHDGTSYVSAGAISLTATGVSTGSVPSTMAFSTNGTTRLALTAAGADVTGAATISGDSLTVGTTSARMLGSAVPVASGSILSTSLSGSGGGVGIENYASATAGPAVTFAKARGGAKSDTPSAAGSSDEYGRVMGWAYSDSQWVEAWALAANANASPSGSVARCNVLLRTNGTSRISWLDASGTLTTQLHDLATAGLVKNDSGGVLSSLAGSATGQTIVWNGSAWVAGALDLADSDARTGLLPIANIAASANDGQTLITTGGVTAWAYGGSIIRAGSNLTTASAARYFPFGVSGGTILTTDVDFAIVPADGYLINLRVRQTTAGSGTVTNTYTVNVNGSNSALTCTIANDSAGDTQDTTHKVSVTAGQRVSFAHSKSGTPASGAQNVVCCVQWVPR